MQNQTKMDEEKILSKHHLVLVKPKEEEKSITNSENDPDDAVPLGLTGKAVCMQVSIECSFSFYLNVFVIERCRAIFILQNKLFRML